MLNIVQVETEAHIRQARELLLEYFDYLRTDVDKVEDLNTIPALAGYEADLAELPGKYAPPDGRLLLALYDGEAAGCVSFFKYGDGVCEVKRLWVRPRFRGKKAGRALMETLVAEARSSGYHTVLLNTVNTLTEAISLYRSLGFEMTAPFYDEVLDYELFMKLELTPK
jgi:putative acetyltransferase